MTPVAGAVPADLSSAGGPLLARTDAPRVFQVTAKPTGAVCNLDCEYCFFLSREALYPGSRFRMADHLQQAYIRQLLEAHARAPEVVVAWQRGEPTMMGLRDQLGATFIQFIPIIERADEQTLPVADSGWGHRVAGRPLYTQTGNLVTRRSVGPAQYGRFLIGVFEEWVRHDVGAVYVQMFDTALANFHGEPGGLCVHAETCGRQLALEHNGDLYSCDHFVEPGYLLGNIGDRHMLDLIASPQQARSGQDKRDTLTRYCRDCDVLSARNGGCPKDRFATSPYGEPGQHYLCPSYQAFFRHVRQPMLAMSALLHDGRAPAEIMVSYAAADARRGRNDSCPCLSGRKWKRCHGSPVAG